MMINGIVGRGRRKCSSRKIASFPFLSSFLLFIRCNLKYSRRMNISFEGAKNELSEVKFPNIPFDSNRVSCPPLFLLYKSQEHAREVVLRKDGFKEGRKKSWRRWNKSNFSRRQPARSSVVKSPIKLPTVFFPSTVRVAVQLGGKMLLDSWETKRKTK